MYLRTALLVAHDVCFYGVSDCRLVPFHILDVQNVPCNQVTV